MQDLPWYGSRSSEKRPVGFPPLVRSYAELTRALLPETYNCCTPSLTGGRIVTYWLRKAREAAAEAERPQLVRLEENSSAEKGRRIEIRYGVAELKLPENVDLKAVAILLNALRSHD